MTDKEPSLRDEIMELYLKYGERDFTYIVGLGWYKLYDAGLLLKYEGSTKLTPKALKLIREET